MMPDGMARTDFAVKLSQGGRELRVWCALGVIALAIAGLAAPILALSRVPGVENVFPWPVAAFEKGLVVHVVFSFVVWFLCAFGALAHLSTLSVAQDSVKAGPLGRVGLAMVAAAFPLLLVPAFLDRGEPTLNNYVPAIIDPLYDAGLLFLATGIALVAARLLVNLAPRFGQADPLDKAMGAAAVIYLSALLAFGVAYVQLGDQARDYTYNEDLFWGGGHILQFLNALLMIVAWQRLSGMALGKRALGGRTLVSAAALLLIPAVCSPLIYGLSEPFSGEQTRAFTLMQYALAPAALLVMAALLPAWTRAANQGLRGGDPARLCLILSPLVFAVGAFLGLFVDGADTRTPAHYHGVIAGINIAFFGLYLTLFLPMMGRAIAFGRASRALVWLFGIGQLAAAIGLFIAGGYGAPRKAAGAEQGLTDLGAQLGLYLNGIGALFAVIGGVMFVVITARALLRKTPD
ncbi:MAG: cbb3-type cytochrome c oxidase subunit I [Magnetovibrionaceae bacterium]